MKRPVDDDTEEDRLAFAARLEQLCAAAGSRARAAAIAGMTAHNLRRLLRGESQATSAVPLRRLAVRTGFDLHWLLTGEGEPRRAARVLTAAEQARPYGAPVEGRGEYFALVLETIGEAYRDAGVAISMSDLARLAFEEYGDTLPAARDETQQAALVHGIGARYRRQLAGSSGPSKASA